MKYLDLSLKKKKKIVLLAVFGQGIMRPDNFRFIFRLFFNILQYYDCMKVFVRSFTPSFCSLCFLLILSLLSCLKKSDFECGF
jgi:hypothetical protein